ncbi:MAG TPA: hypothetical protein VHL34_24740 [Rhizomicrobium sp.]|jgi:hypothetical protein|nr:hypothetical protein [Rhizomicrobium sp.]
MDRHSVALQWDPDGSLTKLFDERAAADRARFGVASGKRGPAFTAPELTPYQRKLESAQAVIRSGFELLLEAEKGRPLTTGELDHCVTQAAIAMRRADPACYEDDKSDAVGETVAYFRGRPSLGLTEHEVREVAQEAIAIFRTVEAKQ